MRSKRPRNNVPYSKARFKHNSVLVNSTDQYNFLYKFLATIMDITMPEDTVNFSDPICTMGSGDALSEILNSIVISGSFLLKEAYCSPWAVSVPSSNILNTLFATSQNVHIATFHLVERGHVHIKLENGEQCSLEAGEMAVCFSGLGHTLYEGDSTNKNQTVIPFHEIMAGTENIFKPDKTRIQDSTSLVCGGFLLQNTLLNPLLKTLPHVLTLRFNEPDEFPRLYGLMKLMIQEFKYRTPGNSYVIERYLEILCAETIRAHFDSLPKQATGWLSALKDPVIGQTVEAIHSQPGYNWTVKNLASKVNMSPSRFAARFVSILGESPIAYIAKWRMFIACEQLKNKHISIEQIANTMGYENLASFSRAFKRHTGLPPGTWRTQKT